MIVSLSYAVLQLIDLGWTRKLAARDNILTNFLHFLGFSLVLFLSDWGDGFWTDVIANQIIILSYLFLIKTTFSSFYINFSKKFFLVLSITIFVIFIFSWFIMGRSIALSFVLTYTILTVLGYALLKLIGSLIQNYSKLHLVFILTFTSLIVIYILRAHHLITSSNHVDSLLDSDKIGTLYIVSLSLFIFIWNYSIQLKRNAIVRAGLEENVTELCDANEDISILNSLFYKGEVKNMNDLYEEIFDLLKNRFSIDKSVIYLFESESSTLKVAALRGIGSSSELSVINSISDQNYSISFESFINQEIKSVNVDDLPFGVLKEILDEQNISKLISYPLTYSGNCLGVLTLGLSQDNYAIEDQIFSSICKQLSGVIYNSQVYDELIKTQKKLKEMATTDHLTGIMNRREFLVRYEDEFVKSQRHGDRFTLFMVDLDDFKNINDTYGHDAGDVVLVSVVNAIVKKLRSSDIFARYGGEEFIGLLLKSDSEGAESKLKDIVEEVSKLVIPGYPEINITITIGTCAYSTTSKKSSQIIKRADIALYKAKKSGKNRVCTSEVISA